MNYGRLAAAVVAATILDAVYGFAVYGTLLAGAGLVMLFGRRFRQVNK